MYGQTRLVSLKTLFQLAFLECAEALGAIASPECQKILEEYVKDSEVYVKGGGSIEASYRKEIFLQT